jgi:hypothetical protein
LISKELRELRIHLIQQNDLEGDLLDYESVFENMESMTDKQFFKDFPEIQILDDEDIFTNLHLKLISFNSISYNS